MSQVAPLPQNLVQCLHLHILRHLFPRALVVHGRPAPQSILQCSTLPPTSASITICIGWSVSCGPVVPSIVAGSFLQHPEPARPRAPLIPLIPTHQQAPVGVWPALADPFSRDANWPLCQHSDGHDQRWPVPSHWPRCRSCGRADSSGCASTIGTLRKAGVPSFASECCITLRTALSLSTALLPQSHTHPPPAPLSGFGLLQHWLPSHRCRRWLALPLCLRSSPCARCRAATLPDPPGVSSLGSGLPGTHVYHASPHFSVAGVADRSPSHGNRFPFHFYSTVGFSTSSCSRHSHQRATSRGCFSSCRCSIPTCSCSRSPSRHAAPPHQLLVISQHLSRFHRHPHFPPFSAASRA